jgi:hypothetical protein
MASSLEAHNAALTTIRTVDETLDQLHTAASNANIEKYFDCFTSDGYFIGTDATERWSIPQFYDYTKPHFDQGHGWTYTTMSRNISYHNVATDESSPSVAWFDELLHHDRFGTTRNSGVMILVCIDQEKQEYVWKVAQYHLTIPIPNHCVDTVVKIIEKEDKKFDVNF